MLEQGGHAEDRLEEQDAFGRYAERQHGREADGEGEQELSGMEPQRRRHVEARVGVVGLMQAPEEWNPMVRSGASP